MKDDVIEMYMQGHSVKEIEEETGLAYGTVHAYISSSGIRRDPHVQERQAWHRIKRLIDDYKSKFGMFIT